MSTAHVLLGLLAGGPRHGYDLKRAHDERLPQAKPLAYGQVYSTLGRLERDGFVEQSGQEQEGGPERTAYTLTESGRERLSQWLTEIEPPAPYVTSTLFAKVVVALLAADYSIGHLDADLRWLQTTLASVAEGEIVAITGGLTGGRRGIAGDGCRGGHGLVRRSGGRPGSRRC